MNSTNVHRGTYPPKHLDRAQQQTQLAAAWNDYQGTDRVDSAPVSRTAHAQCRGRHFKLQAAVLQIKHEYCHGELPCGLALAVLQVQSGELC